MERPLFWLLRIVDSAEQQIGSVISSAEWIHRLKAKRQLFLAQKKRRPLMLLESPDSVGILSTCKEYLTILPTLRSIRAADILI